MPQATQAAFDARVGLDEEALTEIRRAPVAVPGALRLAVHESLAAIEQDWRAFEQIADGTVFQTFDWLSTWQRHIGSASGVMPAVVIGRDDRGHLLFLLPLAIETRWLRAPADLARHRTLRLQRAAAGARLLQARRSGAILASCGARSCSGCEAIRGFGFDLVDLEKMPDTVGAQPNPFMALRRHAACRRRLSDAISATTGRHFTPPSGRLSTRQRDRSKRKKLAEHRRGPLRQPGRASTIVAATLDTLIDAEVAVVCRDGRRQHF